MSAPTWMEQTRELAETAIRSDHFKGGLVKPPKIDEVIEFLKSCLEDELRDGEYYQFQMVLYDPDGNYAGRSETLYCTDRQEAEAIVENVLPPDYLAGKRGYEWRLREE